MAPGAVLILSDIRTPNVPRRARISDPSDDYFRGGWHVTDSSAHVALLMLQR